MLVLTLLLRNSISFISHLSIFPQYNRSQRVRSGNKCPLTRNRYLSVGGGRLWLGLSTAALWTTWDHTMVIIRRGRNRVSGVGAKPELWSHTTARRLIWLPSRSGYYITERAAVAAVPVAAVPAPRRPPGWPVDVYAVSAVLPKSSPYDAAAPVIAITASGR